MASGGKRPGAGRPSGARNKAMVEKQREIEASGLTPLDYMLGVLRDEARSHEDRMDAAKAAAPYAHPRLTSIDANVTGHMSLGAVLDGIDA